MASERKASRVIKAEQGDEAQSVRSATLRANTRTKIFLSA